MKRLRVGVVGASGYSGSVSARLIAIHPRLALAFGTSDKLVGEPLEAHLGVRVDDELRFVSNGSAIEHADACDAVLLCTSADVSMRLGPAFAERGKQVIDPSGAFRLEAGAYPHWYGFEHTAPDALARAHYGLPELFGAPPREGIVSNPGCYPTAALLALAPLVRARLVEPTGIVVAAQTPHPPHAYTRPAPPRSPAIARALSRLGADVKLTFTAHYLPIKRGLFATCYGRPRAGATAARVAECLADAYRSSGFVRAMPPDQVTIKRVVGTNACHVGAAANDDVVIAVGAIDNLLKGAAGQALQNLNLMNGWDE